MNNQIRYGAALKMLTRLMLIAVVLCAGIYATAGARVTDQAAEKASATASNPDGASIDSVVAALYDVISGPAGKKRDWDRMRSLFIQGGRLIPTGKRSGGEIASRVLDVEGYISASSKAIEENGFFEREVSRRTEIFGNIAHVFSTYEGRHKSEDSKPFARGINSIQLMNDGKRWWIVTVFWQAEGPDNPLPEKYLSK